MTAPNTCTAGRLVARCALGLGLAASLAANVLHASLIESPNRLISQGIAAWPAAALALGSLVIERIPSERSWRSGVRLVAAAVVAGVAAVVSYQHMLAVCLHFGESTSSSHIMPLCVDGLVVIASISLSELDRTEKTFQVDMTKEKVSTPRRTRKAAQVDTENATPVQSSRTGNGVDTSTVIRTLKSRNPSWTHGRLALEVGCSQKTVSRALAGMIA